MNMFKVGPLLDPGENAPVKKVVSLASRWLNAGGAAMALALFLARRQRAEGLPRV